MRKREGEREKKKKKKKKFDSLIEYRGVCASVSAQQCVGPLSLSPLSPPSYAGIANSRFKEVIV
jgi:hypothetical protein